MHAGVQDNTYSTRIIKQHMEKVTTYLARVSATLKSLATFGIKSSYLGGKGRRDSIIGAVK